MLTSVLVVEDNLSLAMVLKSYLENVGIQRVECVENGLEALSLIEADPKQFQGIITDLHMPVLDGMELLKRLGKTQFSGGVILISNLDERVMKIAANLARKQHIHLVGVLAKPIDRARLALLLHRIENLKQAVSLPDNLLKKRELESAIEEGRILVYYQPKIHGTTKQITGFEVLCRLSMTGEMELVAPDRFIPVAEKFHLIDELSYEIFTRALAEFKEIRQVCSSPVNLALNVTPSQLENERLPDMLNGLCQTFEITSDAIVVEITECQVLRGDHQLASLNRLRVHGYDVSLDDFGLGFTSMGQLKHYPFTELKLDQSMVENIANDNFSQVILKCMNDISAELKIDLVAEGVETIEDFNYVVEHSQAQIQGDICCMPKPKDELIRWINAWQAELGA